MDRTLTILFVTIGLVGTLLAAGAGASDISVSAVIEPGVVPVGNEATLVVSVTGKFRRSSEPELPPLDDFQVYQAGTSQNFSIVNGSMRSSLQFTYVVIPGKEGRYTIEPIKFRVGDKEYTANSVELEVVKATSQLPLRGRAGTVEEEGGAPEDRSIFIRATADRDTVYVNQQITWTLGFYTDGRVDLLRSPNYHPPSSEGFWVEDLPPQKRYYTHIGGREYLVNEIKRAYFPTAPGVYTIGGSKVEIVVDDRGRDLIDDFFSRRIRSFGFGKPATLSSETIGVTVLPLPRRGKPAGFTGVVARDLTLAVRADKQVVQAGEPINVTVEIEGKGNIKTVSLPDFTKLSGFKTYESGSSFDVFKTDYVVTGRKRYEYVVIPTSEGVQEIPSLTVHYFDPQLRRYETVRSDPITLDVKPGAQEEGRRIIYAGTGDEIEVLGRDIRHIRPVPASIATGGRRIYRSRLYVALHALPLLAVFVSLTVDSRRRRWRDQGPAARAARALKQAERKLAEATRLVKKNRHADAFALVSGALRGYLADKMNAASSGLTSDAMEDFLRQEGADDEQTAAFGRVIRDCDAVRYSPAGSGADQARDVISRSATLLRGLEKGCFR